MINLALQYILSDEDTPKVIAELEKELTLIRESDIWRREQNISRIGYDVKRTYRTREATNCCLDRYAT